LLPKKGANNYNRSEESKNEATTVASTTDAKKNVLKAFSVARLERCNVDIRNTPKKMSTN
jgi:hypothetical protein